MTSRMSKITFRADDELIERLEEFDASKSEIMREALREFLDANGDTSATATDASDTTGEAISQDSIDALIAERVDTIIADRLDGAFTPSQPQDVNVNIALDGDSAVEQTADGAAVDMSDGDGSHAHPGRKTGGREGENTDTDERKTCPQCGESVGPNHVYCPNCGEKATHRVFCDCGDELRSDWAFCPSCGRRTPAADVLDQS